jgi:hypothetical protein
MSSRSRSGPSPVAMSIERTTSTNSTVTCLYSAAVWVFSIGAPQASQNRAPVRGSTPHDRHVTAAVICNPRVSC